MRLCGSELNLDRAAPSPHAQYNDVRVNRLVRRRGAPPVDTCARPPSDGTARPPRGGAPRPQSAALMHVLDQPLPGVLRERVMDPIGCSDTWAWHGYSTSWEKLACGVWAQGVSGGGHWGGGLHISSRDHARFGLLLARGGVWGGDRLIPEGWIARATAPCEQNELYGFMWWLYPGSAAFAARGAGGNFIYIDPERDLVVVARWCADRDGLVARVLAALAS